MPCPTTSAICEALRPQEDLRAWEWVEKHWRLSGSGRNGPVSFKHIPMGRHFLDAFEDPRIKRITTIASAQSIKTKVHEMALAWAVVNRPMPCIWLTDTENSRDEFYDTRTSVMLNECAALDAYRPVKRTDDKKGFLRFASMDMFLLYASARRNLERNPAALLFGDEVRNWKPGTISTFENRKKSFREWKMCLFSVAGKEHDQLHNAWRNGSRTIFHWTCPNCGHAQPFRFGRKATTLYPEEREFGGIIWDDDDERINLGGGIYDQAAFMRSVRYQCENGACLFEFRNHDKAALIKTLQPVDTHPMAPPDDKSFTWNELYMPWEDSAWPILAWRFVSAKYKAKHGDLSELMTFVMERLAEPWRPPAGTSVDAGILARHCGDYAIGERHPDTPGVIDWLHVDHQAECEFVLHRQTIIDPNSLLLIEDRLINAFQLLSLDDVRGYQTKHGIQDKFVSVDSRFNPRDVYKACLRYGRWEPNGNDARWNGWMPLTGDPAREFTHTLAAGLQVKRKWAVRKADPNIGTNQAGQGVVPRLHLSKDGYREQLFQNTIGVATSLWLIPKNAIEAWGHLDRNVSYIHQMGNVVREKVLDAAGNITGEEWHEKGRHDYPDLEMHHLAMLDYAGINPGNAPEMNPES